MLLFNDNNEQGRDEKDSAKAVIKLLTPRAEAVVLQSHLEVFGYYKNVTAILINNRVARIKNDSFINIVKLDVGQNIIDVSYCDLAGMWSSTKLRVERISMDLGLDFHLSS